MSVEDWRTYSCSLGDFDLEFDIDMDESVYGFRVFAGKHPENFAYVAGSIWVRQKHSRYLVREFNTANLVLWMQDLASKLEVPPAISPDVLASVGFHVCRWFTDYWDRVDRDTASVADEETYDSLSSYCLVSEGAGCIAVFAADGGSIVQVCSKQSKVVNPLCFEARPASAVASALRKLSAEVAQEVRRRSTQH